MDVGGGIKGRPSRNKDLFLNLKKKLSTAISQLRARPL